jgi:hypothetical protein
MNIIETSEFFKKLLKLTTNKRERKVYQEFSTILINLISRDLSQEELLRIESEIRALKLKSNSKNKRRFFIKKLNMFKQFLNKEFLLISEGYYTSLGMSLGMCFGVAIGTSLGASGTSIGLCLGMLIGLVIGHYKDIQAEKKNLVLKTKTSIL